VLPGGPGVASVLPYRRIRRRLAAAGFHVVTPEHRGVGRSRRLPDGSLLPVEAVTMEQAARDVLAVRDAVGGERAILAGTSYGGFLALEAARLGRFEALVIDSAGASVEPSERERQRAMFWDGTEPGFAEIAARVRALARTVPDDELALAVPLAYELAGAKGLQRMLAHPAALRLFARLAALETGTGRIPLVFDGDLTIRIMLGRMAPELPDGRPFDRSRALDRARAAHPGVPAEPFDATPWLGELDLPVLVLQGGRDTRIPPATVDALVEGLPDASRAVFPRAGHDVLRMRTRECARLIAA
jgi:proline iminopeptidase